MNEGVKKKQAPVADNPSYVVCMNSIIEFGQEKEEFISTNILYIEQFLDTYRRAYRRGKAFFISTSNFQLSMFQKFSRCLASVFLR